MKIFHIGNPNSLNVQNFVEDFSEMGHEIHTMGTGLLDYSVNKNVIHHSLGRKRANVKTNSAKPVEKGVDEPIKEKKRGWIWHLLKAYNNFRIRRMVKWVNPDIIHGHEADGNGTLTASLNEYPRILSCWGSDIHRVPWESEENKKRIENALQSVDVVHVTNDDFGQFIHEKLGVKSQNIKVINIGIDFKQFNPDNLDVKKISKFRERFMIPQNKKIILYPAGFRNKDLQNYINILKAFNEIKDDHSVPHLVMLSYGRTSGIDEIMEIIKKNDLWDRVTIIDDYIPHEEMPYLLHITDVFVIIHDVDQLARSIIESMIMGCVPILSKIKPYLSKFEEREHCLFVNQKNVDEIATSMLEALDGLSYLKEKFKSKNKPWAVKIYDTEILNAKIFEMYESLLSK
jgi:L-malate glycosyltransferase